MDAARKYGTPISYDLNFRDSLWKSIGGKAKAQEVNRELVRKVDLLLGNEEDFSAMLGISLQGRGGGLCRAAGGELRADAARRGGGVSESENDCDDAADRAYGNAQRVGRDGAV